MAKAVGFPYTIAIDDSGGSIETISNDITDFSFETPRTEFDSTGVDKSARERLLGLVDFTANFVGPFNRASSPSSHDVFKTTPSSSVARTVTLTLDSQVLAGELFPLNYSWARGADGSFVFAAPMALESGTVPSWT